MRVDKPQWVPLLPGFLFLFSLSLPLHIYFPHTRYPTPRGAIAHPTSPRRNLPKNSNRAPTFFGLSYRRGGQEMERGWRRWKGYEQRRYNSRKIARICFCGGKGSMCLVPFHVFHIMGSKENRVFLLPPKYLYPFLLLYHRIATFHTIYPPPSGMRAILLRNTRGSVSCLFLEFSFLFLCLCIVSTQYPFLPG